MFRQHVRLFFLAFVWLAASGFAGVRDGTREPSTSLPLSSGVTGVWTWTRTAPDGTTARNLFTLTLTGSELTGNEEYAWGGTVSLRGQLVGSQVQFTVGEEFPSTYTGTYDRQRMHLVRTEGSKSSTVELSRLPPGASPFPVAPPPPALHRIPRSGLAITPPMGWNAWNHFHDDLDG